jgi:hypothetical protein
MPHPQTLNYTTPTGDNQQLEVSAEVVTSNGSQYYLVMLGSSTGLDSRLTAIPLTCNQPETQPPTFPTGTYYSWNNSTFK